MAQTRTPAVSVIIPVFNGEAYLRPCLDSVFQQTLKRIQVICVNDGSTDGSAAILEEYQAQHPDMQIVTQPNGGLSAARNAGLALATGEYLDFLDCDDTLSPDALERLYNRACQDQLDMLFFDGETVYASEKLREALPNYVDLYRTKIRHLPACMPGEELFVRLVRGASYRASACMYLLRREFLLTQGYTFVPGVYYEDNVFTLQCLLSAPRTGIDPTPYYRRSLREDSIVTVRKNYRHARSYYICQNTIQSFLLSRQFAQETVRCAQVQVNSLLNNACRVYSELSPAERREAQQQDPNALLIDRMVMGGIAATSPAAAQARQKNKKLTPAQAAAAAQMKAYQQTPFNSAAPMISVIVPVYNADMYLENTLHDLRHQTLRNFEMIFVDDGSTDESVSIIERCAKEDPRIILLRQQNQYAGVARNNGMKHARGEYLLFLDADDSFDHNLLARTYACAKANQAEIVLYHADLLQMPAGTLSPAKFLCPCDRLPQHVFSGQEGKDHIFDVLNPWTKLYSRAYIQQLGIQYQALYSSNDLYFSMIAMACAKRIAPLPEVLVHYRVGITGNIQSTKSKAPLNTFHAFVGVQDELVRRGLYDTFRTPFAVKAAESMLRTLDTMTSMDGYRHLYQTLHDGGLQRFDIACLSAQDMAHIAGGSAKLSRCRDIVQEDFDTYALRALTGQGAVGQMNQGYQAARLQAEVNALRESRSYRLGNMMLQPLRLAKRVLGRLRRFR